MMIHPYLQSHLTVADQLPQILGDDVHPDTVEMLQRRIRQLVQLVANRDQQIAQLEQRAETAHVGP